jgi:peptide/nickel transport system permease protein
MTGNEALASAERRPVHHRFTGRVARRLRPPPAIVIASLIVGLVAVCVVASGVIVPDALRQDLVLGVQPAGAAGHPLGTDSLGRDVLALSVAGASSAVLGPIVIAIGSILLGIGLGLVAGFRGGFVDAFISRSTELLLALPVILLAIVVAGVIGGGYWVTVAVLIVLFSPTDVRMVRAAVLQQRNKPYVEATYVLGLSSRRIMFRHLLPNVMPVVLANFFLNIAFALVALSGLSYLGLGVSPGSADWGRQLSDGRSLLFDNPAAAVVPGALIIVTAAAVNLIGDWIAERLTLTEVI